MSSLEHMGPETFSQKETSELTSTEQEEFKTLINSMGYLDKKALKMDTETFHNLQQLHKKVKEVQLMVDRNKTRLN